MKTYFCEVQFRKSQTWMQDCQRYISDVFTINADKNSMLCKSTDGMFVVNLQTKRVYGMYRGELKLIGNIRNIQEKEYEHKRAKDVRALLSEFKTLKDKCRLLLKEKHA